MASIASLATDVHTITNRPDLVSETIRALRKAINKLHSAETFPRDLTRVRLQMALYSPVQPDQYRWAFDLSDADLFPRFRRLYSLNYPTDLIPPTSNVPAPLIDGWASLGPERRQVNIVSVDNLFDSYRDERYQYAYIAGMSMQVKLSWAMDYLDVWYYMWPQIPSDPEDTIQSWICDQFPDAVVDEACADVFKMIGKDDESALYRQLFNENLAMLKTSVVGEDQ